MHPMIANHESEGTYQVLDVYFKLKPEQFHYIIMEKIKSYQEVVPYNRVCHWSQLNLTMCSSPGDVGEVPVT